MRNLLERRKGHLFWGKFCWRLGIYFTGLFLLALGVALTVKSDLGVGPGNLVAYSLSLIFQVELGNMTTYVFLVYVLLQLLLLRKEFSVRNVLQIPFSFIYGQFVSFWVGQLNALVLHTYYQRLLCIVLSVLVAALGLTLFLQADIVAMPAEGLLIAILHFHKRIKFSVLKVAYDSSCTVFAAVATWCCFGRIIGVREGSAISAVFLGIVIGFYQKYLTGPLNRLCFLEECKIDQEEERNETSHCD